MTGLMPRGAAALAAALLLGAPAIVSAQCAMPDPPMFRAQGKITDFATLSAADQATVRAFDHLAFSNAALPRPTQINRLDNGTPGGHPDLRSPEERYLSPDHPDPQPNVGQSAWKRVNCVELADPAEIATQRDGATRELLRTLPQIIAPAQIRATYVRTPPSLFPGMADTNGDGVKETVDPFANPPGTNMLPTVYRNLTDTRGGEMVNTLPSTKTEPYKLHAAAPEAVRINPESPIDDLRYILENVGDVILDTPYRDLLARPDQVTLDDLKARAADAPDRVAARRDFILHHAQWGIDLAEGNGDSTSKVPGDRGYRGFPLLNHSGHKRVKRVLPVYDANGQVIGGDVEVRQVWYGGRVQSDTMFFDFGYDRGGPAETDYANCGGDGQPTQQACLDAAPIPPNMPWTITYKIAVLSRGNDDFSPMVMQFDCPGKLTIDGVDVGCTSPAETLLTRKVAAADPPVQKAWPTVVWTQGPLHASFDQTFFPMEDGTEVTIKINMAPPQYFNLTYTWGWRNHPPRAQATENSHKIAPPVGLRGEQMFCHPLAAAIVEHERWAFEGFAGPLSVAMPPPPEAIHAVGLAAPGGADFDTCLAAFRTATGNPAASGLDMMNARLGLLNMIYPKFSPAPVTEREKIDAAISRISDLAPEKRLWRAFGLMRDAAQPGGAITGEEWLSLLLDARDAFLDWRHRTRLPSGLKPDPKSDLTLLFVNNTIYGELREGGYIETPSWRRRGDMLKITLLNGDYFPHGYLNVDFGGLRGWEDLWKSTVKTAGSGAWFSFGRFHARFNTVPGSILVDAARALDAADAPLTHGEPPAKVEIKAHRLMLEMNFEPSPRLRFYQFDPLHHDAAIYSMH
jgi:hypothetical protein